MALKAEKPFVGSACALVTPFKDDSVDLDALGTMLERQTEGGTAAVAVCGTTGEAPSLSDGEYESIVEYTAEKLRGRLPLIAGAGAASTSHAVRLARLARKAGADALLAVTPYYLKASEKGLIAHYSSIAEVGLPVILYNVPSRTGMSISLSAYEKLSEIEGIVGVKEASGDIRCGIELAYTFGDRFALYCGCDELNLPLSSVGFDGFISVTANVAPEKLSRLWRLISSGDTAAAKALDRELYPLTRSLFSEVNPIPVKKALSELGLCKNELRLPLCGI